MPGANQQHYKHNHSQQQTSQHLLTDEFHVYWFSEFGSML
jgi:hypothetical protein